MYMSCRNRLNTGLRMAYSHTYAKGVKNLKTIDRIFLVFLKAESGKNKREARGILFIFLVSRSALG